MKFFFPFPCSIHALLYPLLTHISYMRCIYAHAAATGMCLELRKVERKKKKRNQRITARNSTNVCFSVTHTSWPDAINRLQNWFSNNKSLFLYYYFCFGLQHDSYSESLLLLLSFVLSRLKGTFRWHLLQKAQQSLISLFFFRQNNLYFPSLCNESVVFGVFVRVFFLLRRRLFLLWLERDDFAP